MNNMGVEIFGAQNSSEKPLMRPVFFAGNTRRFNCPWCHGRYQWSWKPYIELKNCWRMNCRKATSPLEFYVEGKDEGWSWGWVGVTKRNRTHRIVRRFFPTWISSQLGCKWLGSPPFLRNEVRPFERGPTTPILSGRKRIIVFNHWTNYDPIWLMFFKWIETTN